MIDGINIKDYSLQSVRSLMSIVTQEPILFNDTIANNIRLGKETATEEEIIERPKWPMPIILLLKKKKDIIPISATGAAN